VTALAKALYLFLLLASVLSQHDFVVLLAAYNGTMMML
jgi:hypothetical protein